MPPPCKAIVTGHSRGLGAAIAEQFLANGIPVLGCARRSNAELAARFPALFSQAPLDLGDATALAAWLDGPSLGQFCADTETIFLVNNAGTLGPIGPAQTQPASEIAHAVQINVAAPLMLTSTLARVHPGALRVLHVSSGAARAPYAGWSVYCATKAALDHHARAMAADQRADLRICSLAPGVIDTDMQTTLRSTPETHFPMLKKFQKLKNDNLLTPPHEAARRIVAYLRDASFGSALIADLREIP